MATGHTEHEKELYGKTWDTVHGGYFGDPAIALPLVEAVLDAVYFSKPDVLADLGGGTGFVLEEIGRRMEWSSSPALVCVDTAREQLDCCPEPISAVESSVEGLERGVLVEPGGKLMVCMRSVLHYFGEEKLKLDLGRLRSILEPGEHLVHQTICFWSEREQALANLLYERMDTGKWYPTVSYLVDALKVEGFRLDDIRPAAPIPLTSAELEERYAIEHEKMLQIGADLKKRRGGHLSEVFHETRNGFISYLEYLVMTCTAV